MSQNFSRKLRFFASFVVLPLVLAKLLWSLSLFFLDKGTLQSQTAENYSYHYSLNLAPKIIAGSNGVIKEEPVETDDGEELKNIKLKGTYLGGDASFMIIEDAGKSNFIYIGESYKGYELVRVSEKKVGLEKNGKSYYILLQDEESKPQRPKHPGSHEIPGMPEVEHIPGAPVVITKNELNSYIKNPNKIWKNIRIQEQRVNGQISGFRVNYVKKSSFFDKAGLKSGDIIKGIDGNEITSLADVMKYYTNIENIDSLTLTVDRAGEELELDFNVN